MAPDSATAPTGAGPPPVGAVAGRLARLAGPIVLSRAGILVYQTVDLIVVGSLGPQPVGALALGMAIGVPLMLLGVGLAAATGILVAQAAGAGRPAEAGHALRSGLAHALAAGVLLALPCLAGEAILRALGQPPALAEAGARVLMAYAAGLPGILVGVAAGAFLEALGRPLPVLVSVVAANVANLFLDLWLVHGGAGLPALGAEGAMLATSLARWAGAAGLLAYAFAVPALRPYRRRGPAPAGRPIGRRLRRLGVPMGLALAMETAFFMATILLAGRLGAVALAGYQISLNVLAVAAMGASGLAAATGVLVARAVGAGDDATRRRTARLGVAGGALLLGVVGLGIAGFATPVAGLYVDDPATLAIAGAVLAVTGLLMWIGGIEMVAIQVLRGSGEAWRPLALQGAGFWLVGLPAAALLAFGGGLGPLGLTLGVSVGLSVSAALNLARMRTLDRRAIAPV